MSLHLFYKKTNELEAGCDEAGRGCIAGPVVAASVVLPSDFPELGITDSKLLSDKKRRALRPLIEKKSLTWAVSFVDNNTIDTINILQASFLAMHQAIGKLQTTPTLLLIDGNRFTPYPNIPHHCIIKGDSQYLSIAAASILAKTYRDDYMCTLHNKYPAYGWNVNKGYPTQRHKQAVLKHGMTNYHRKSYHINFQQKLDL